MHGKELDENLGLNIGLATAAGFISGITSPGASKTISTDGKESFVKLATLDEGKTITTIKQVSADNSAKEVIISVGQEIAGRLSE